MFSWPAVLLAIACVPVGVLLRGRSLKWYAPPVVWETKWVRLLLLTLIIVGVGEPAMTGLVWLSPVYGVLLGLITGTSRRRCGRLRA